MEDQSQDYPAGNRLPKRHKAGASNSSLSEFSSAPESLLQVIEHAQKESLWKLLEEKKSECYYLRANLEQTEENLASVRLKFSKSLMDDLNLEKSQELLADEQIEQTVQQVFTALQSRFGSDGIVTHLNGLKKEGELEATIEMLEEERLVRQQLLAEREEQLLLLERRNRRLELAAAKRTIAEKGEKDENKASAQPEKHVSESSMLEQVRNEIEVLKNLASQRLEELENIERERAELRYQNVQLLERLRRVSEDAMKDPRKMGDLHEEIQNLRNELGRQRRNIDVLENDVKEYISKKESVLLEMEASVSDKRMGMKKFIDVVQAEASRMRKERDNMRELYEHANTQVTSANRTISNLQTLIGRLEERVKIAESQDSRLKTIANLLESIKSSEVEAAMGLKNALESIKDNEEELYQELETLGKAFEDVQEQNKTLIRQISEREELHGKLLNEKLRAEFSLVQIKKESELTMQKANDLEQLSLERLEAAELRERAARALVSDTENKVIRRLIDAEKTQTKLTEVLGENARLKRQLENVSNSRLEDALAEGVKALEAINFEKKRLKEEVEFVQAKLKRFTESAGVPQQELEKELAMYKKLMKCNSCHIRDKNAVITKCMHVFCRQCLELRIETRQRKCPNCGDPFGINDLRNIYL